MSWGSAYFLIINFWIGIIILKPNALIAWIMFVFSMVAGFLYFAMNH